MKLNYLKFGTTAFVWLLGTALVSGQQLIDQAGLDLKDLSSIRSNYQISPRYRALHYRIPGPTNTQEQRGIR